MQRILDAFRDEANALDAVVGELPEEDFGRPTNCPPWTVKDLVVHIAVVLPRPGSLPDASSARSLAEAADFYRRPERARPEYHQEIAERAQESAAEIPDGRAAARLLRERWQSAYAELTEADPQRLVELAAGVTTLSDYFLTRVVSHAAHGLDLAISLDREPWTTPSALAVMQPVFVSLLGSEPPAELGWSEQDFFARATGRQDLTAEDRAGLGAHAAAFPLLS